MAATLAEQEEYHADMMGNYERANSEAKQRYRSTPPKQSVPGNSEHHEPDLRVIDLIF